VQQQIDLVFIAKMPRVKEPRQVQPQPQWQWLYLPWFLGQHNHKCIFVIAIMPTVKESRQVQPKPQWQHLPWLLGQHNHKRIFCYCHNANSQGAKVSTAIVGGSTEKEQLAHHP
jgi:hypothetical protein